MYMHTLYFLYFFTSTVVVAVAVAVVLQLEWMTTCRLDWTGLDSHLSS